MTWQSGYNHGQTWTGVDWLDRSADGLVVDPYLVWAEATDYADLGGRPEPKGVDLTADSERKMRVPVIIELAEDPEKFINLLQSHQDWKWVRVSPLYLKPRDHLKGARFFTAIVAREFFTELVHGALKPHIKRFELGLPMKPFGAAEARAHARLSGKKSGHLDRSSGTSAAVIGIIDDGLAFAHQRFLRADGSTRIDYFWNQGYPVPPDSLMTEGPGYGWEFTNGSIEDLMKSARRGGLVDEDLVYREAAYGEVARHWAHGTHVMDLACGLAPGETNAALSHIIGVQIQPPSRTTRDRSSGWLAVHALDGLRYIMDRAEEVGRKGLPVVVNLSFGHIAGPHDGSSTLEEAIRELIEASHDAGRPFEVVVAAGNSLQSRCHASIDLAPGQQEVLHWRVLPDDATPSFMEIWPEAGAAATPGLEVEVTTPWGDSSGPTQPCQVHTWQLGGQVLSAIVRLERVATGKGRMILLAVAPTQRLDREAKVAPCGTWSVRIRNLGAKAVSVNAYIERDETPYGFPRRGRQSRFDDPKYERFDKFGRLKQNDAKENPGSDIPESYIKRARTINSIATGDHTVVIAAYRASDKAMADYSSSGAEISAAGVSEDSVTCHGILAAGSRSGSTVAMNGTSVAAPQLTRRLAEQLAANPPPPPSPDSRPPGRKIVGDFAQSRDPDAIVGPNINTPPRAERFGKGRADARPRQVDIRRRIDHSRGG